MLLDINASTLSATGVLCMLLCLIVKLFETSPVPKNIPWVLSKKGFFGRAAERFLGVNPIGFIQEGYEQVGFYSHAALRYRMYTEVVVEC
jgi:hypothetical protein